MTLDLGDCCIHTCFINTWINQHIVEHNYLTNYHQLNYLTLMKWSRITLPVMFDFCLLLCLNYNFERSLIAKMCCKSLVSIEYAVEGRTLYVVGRTLGITPVT
jgi:hypothetical protein